MGHILRARDLWLDCHRFTVTTPEGTVQLTRTEFRLLRHLVKHAGRLCSWQELVRKAWDYMPNNDGYLVRQYVVRLRKKMGPEHIKNVRSLGYMVEAEEKA